MGMEPRAVRNEDGGDGIAVRKGGRDWRGEQRDSGAVRARGHSHRDARPPCSSSSSDVAGLRSELDGRTRDGVPHQAASLVLASPCRAGLEKPAGLCCSGWGGAGGGGRASSRSAFVFNSARFFAICREQQQQQQQQPPPP
ncbi:unnamed protein product [Lampetra fluviatilis]